MPAPGWDSQRGYTDLLTGSTRLLDIPANALFKFLVQGKLPPSFLPSFLHEATHFWCMSSDMGATLALLEMRAHHDIASEEVDNQRLIHDLGVTAAAHQLFRPLLEGMALFQEFDAITGNSRVISSPSYWASFLFQPLDQDPPEFKNPAERSQWRINRIRQILLGYRTGTAALHRKLGVLMRSISDDPHHYLSGYLTVKQVWLNAVGKTPAFRDPDLFISYLRDWVFQDWKLMTYLTSADLNCGAATYLMSERLQTRFVELATVDLSPEVAVFEAEIDGARDPAKLLWSLRIKESQAEEAQNNLGAMLDEIRAGMDGSEDDNWYLADMLTLRHRQEMMRLACEPVNIEVNEYNRVLVRKGSTIESTYMAGPAPPLAEKGITPGHMTAYFLPKTLAVLAIAVRDNQPMIAIGPEAIPENELEFIRFAVTKVVATEAARRDFTAVGRRLINGMQDEDYDVTLSGLPAHIRQIYTFYALSSVPEDRAADVEARLSRKGLYDLLDKNGDLLSALAKITLFPVGADGSAGELMAKMLSEDGIDLAAVLTELRHYQEKTGMQILLGKDDRSIWHMV